MRPETKLVQQFDQNGDGRLNAAERKAAREQRAKDNASGSRRGGPGRMGPRAQASVAATPGPKVSPSDVASHTGVPFYDPKTVRTVFLQFENADWERELSDFHDTDVLVPAQVTVDGKIYADVGVHFRGMSSYDMVGEGRKRSLNLTLDFVHDGQNVGGYRTLNLLNSHEDPSFLRAVLFYDIAREYLPAPKANFVQVVINGESWGLYVNVEQFNKDFVKEWYGSKKGARWKVPGSPGGRGSLAYLGTNVDDYRKIYEIKSKDDVESWKALIELCRILNETPADKLEAALEPVLDVDGALRFLALDNALINNDGYWIRTSDYSIYRDEKGRFHILPQDANESFSRPGGPGFGGGPGGGPGFGRRPRGGEASGISGGPAPRPEGAGPVPGAPAGGFPPGGRGGTAIQGVDLDPLFAASDASKPLISKLLAVPSLKARYLAHVREIADRHLDWKNLGPRAEAYHALIASAVAADTRKLDSTESFQKSLTEDDGRTLALKNFADQRRAYLLKVTPASAASK
ncbi:MAG: CotH kinase family protein [Verrucomicrobiales bacterium]|nr:CotH kinase family protein [Verrucomicrobiales bacterium]